MCGRFSSDHLNAPFGVVLVGNDLSCRRLTDAILRFPYRSGETRITAPGVKLTDLPAGPIDHHWTKSPDGQSGRIQALCRRRFEQQHHRKWPRGRGRTHRHLGSGSPERLQAHLCFGAAQSHRPRLRRPQSGKLWAIVNETRPRSGPRPGPRLSHPGARRRVYGWPYGYFGQHVDVRVQPQRPDLVATAVPPDYALSSHVAPLGIVFSQNSSLPMRYRNGVFIAEHGSWDRSPLNGYKIVYVPFAAGRPSGPPQDVVTGFLAPDQNHVYGRPVGLALDRTGALLIADDVGNAVWRVETAAPSSRPASLNPTQTSLGDHHDVRNIRISGRRSLLPSRNRIAGRPPCEPSALSAWAAWARSWRPILRHPILGWWDLSVMRNRWRKAGAAWHQADPGHGRSVRLRHRHHHAAG